MSTAHQSTSSRLAAAAALLLAGLLIAPLSAQEASRRASRAPVGAPQEVQLIISARATAATRATRAAGAVVPDAPRTLPITVDASAFLAADPARPIHFELPLPGGVRLTAHVQERPQVAGGGFSAFGRLDDHPLSNFALAGDGDGLYGVFRSYEHGTFQVGRAAGGGHVLRPVQAADRRPCGGAHDQAGPPADGDAPAPPGYAVDTGEILDVLVVYTQDAVDAASPDSISSVVSASIADTNLRLANGDADPRVRLVARALLVGNETGDASVDLTNLRVDGDGIWDGTHDLREEYGADLVHLIVAVSDGVGGLGNRPSSQAGLTASNGFALSNVSQVMDRTMAHEIGHNLGCHHHPDDADAASGNIAGDDPTLYPYAFGHRAGVVAPFRTTMAYTGLSLFDTASFSNPDIEYVFVDTGIAGERDNARVIDNTADEVANYFPSVNFVGPNAFPGDGSQYSPFFTLALGVAATPAGHTVRLLSDQAFVGTISSAVVLEADDGPVVIN